MPTKRPSEKNTKAEILSAFDQLLQEKKALELQLVQKSELKPTEIRNGKSAPEKAINPAQLSQQTMESIIAGLTQLQFNFGGAVSDLSEKLTLEAFKLQELQQAIATEQDQLRSLHNLEATDGTLDSLIEQYETSAKTFNDEVTQRRQTVEQELTQIRKAWFKEQDDHRRLIKERNESTAKTRQRDAKEYTYNLTLQRHLSDEEFEQEQKRLYQELDEFRQLQEQEWAEREKSIGDRESQFNDLKAKVDGLSKELETAIKRAREEGKGIANQQAKVKADLLAADIEGQKRTYELRLDFLEETIEDQASRISSLTKQLEAALKQVQDLAVKAIEGASDISSFEAVREIAIEQAKSQNKAK